MHKIVLDTNVLISAIITHGYPYRILHNLVATERIKICLSEPILSEYTNYYLAWATFGFLTKLNLVAYEFNSCRLS